MQRFPIHQYRFCKTIICHNCKKPGHLQSDCKSEKINAVTERVNAVTVKALEDQVKALSMQLEEIKEKNLSTYSSSSINLSVHDPFILDSGASSHITNQKDLFQNFEERNSIPFTLPDNSTLWSTGTGQISVPITMDNGCTQQLLLDNAHFIPEINKNIISVSIYQSHTRLHSMVTPQF